MSDALVQPILNSFLQRTPLRVGSLIVTIFGDAVLPYGEFIRLSSLMEITSAIGIEKGAVRVAMHRLEKDGWLKKQKSGRNVLYALSETGREESRHAAELIYGFDRPDSTGDLQMLILADGAGRAGHRDMLLQNGWGQVASNILLTSGSPQQLSALDALPVNGNQYLLPLNTEASDVVRLCAKAWGLDALNTAYGEVADTFQPVEQLLNSGQSVSLNSALVLRILLIHDYRRLVLKDPFLPVKALPDNWCGTELRRIVSTIYPLLKQRSEGWIERI